MSEQSAQILGMATADFVGKVVFLAIVIAISALIAHFVSRAARRAIDVSRVPSASIFINILRGFIWAFSLLIVLEPVFGVQPTAFVTALGVSGVVISFGLQDTVKNVIAGLILMTTRALKPGDDVKFGDIRGRVTDITWRNTVLHTRSGDDLVIPNSVLNNTAFTRLSEMDARETLFRVTLAPGVDPSTVERDIQETIVSALGEWNDETYGVLVWPAGLTPYGTDVDVRIHLKPGIMWEDAVHLAVCSIATKPYLSSVGAASLR